MIPYPIQAPAANNCLLQKQGYARVRRRSFFESEYTKAQSARKEKRYVRYHCTVVQRYKRSIKTRPPYSQYNNTFICRCLGGELTPYRRCTGISGSSRLQIVLATKRSMEFLAIKLIAPWRSLMSFYTHSLHSLMPSSFDGMSYSNQSDCGGTYLRRSIAIPTA